MTALRKDRENVELADTMAYHQQCGYVALDANKKELTVSITKELCCSVVGSTRLGSWHCRDRHCSNGPGILAKLELTC